MIDNDADSLSGTGYTIAEIVAAVTAADALRVDSGTGFPTYRFLKNLTVGGATTNPTHLVDGGCCLTFDNTRAIKTRATNLTNIGITFGTRVGSGSTGSGGNGVTVLIASGTGAMLLRGTIKLYGTRIAKGAGGAGALQIANLNSGSELVNCQLDGFGGYVLGSNGANLDLAYNVDATQGASGVSAVLTSFFVTTATRLTISTLKVADAQAAIQSSTAGVSFGDTIFFGDFTGGSSPGLLNNSATATDWQAVRPEWPANVNLMAIAGVTDPNHGVHEYWPFLPVVVDGVTGTTLSGIPVRLTDGLGNLLVDTTTNANGMVSFGSGLTANSVIVADYYTNGVANLRRSRSPFTVKVNQTGVTNPSYPSVTYNFYWPGDSSGRYSEVGDVIPLGNPAAGVATVWTEAIVS